MKGLIKKMTTFAIVSAIACTPLTALAVEPGTIGPGSVTWTRDGVESEETWGLDLKYSAVAKPSYTIKVPQTLQMAKGGTDVPITVSDTKNLSENKVYLSVSVTDTFSTSFPKAYRDEAHIFNLYRGYNFMSYTVQAKNTDGSYADPLTALNQELLAFNDNGTQYYRVTPGDDATETGTYWGAIKFNIKFADVVAE